MKKILSTQFLLFFLLIFGAYACSKSSDTPIKEETNIAVKLSSESQSLTVGEEFKIFTEITSPDKENLKDYQWRVIDENILEIVQVDANFNVSIKAKAVGTTRLLFNNKKGEQIASCEINVVNSEKVDDGITKILTIGNSFSDDAVEHYLYGLAAAKGHKIVIGNLYIGGASLSLHVQNATNNIANYSYRKINEQGVKAVKEHTAIASALADEDWDYISFQQESPNSGKFETFSPLITLYNYVKPKALNPDVKYVLHQTWAYAKNSTHSGFANYGKDQLVMYESIVDAYNRAKALIPVEFIVPAGTAIQNGRTSIIGDNFCRDGYHLDISIGRYTASCTWFESIFKESVIGNTFKPEALGLYETEIAQHAAHYAVINPNRVTQLADYQGGGDSDFKVPILINFGGNSVPYFWNVLSDFKVGTTINNLKDEQAKNTGLSLQIVEGFNNRNQNGATSSTTSMNMPSGVSSDSYYGNSKLTWEGKSVKQSVLRITGLNKEKVYNFCFFGSRVNAGNENRETKYSVKGKNEVIAVLDAANNTSKIAYAQSVIPNEEGAVLITITAGENNTNEYGFYYINALEIKQID